jgi:hypothetical protein
MNTQISRHTALVATVACLLLSAAAGGAARADTPAAVSEQDAASGITTIDPGPAPGPGASADTIPFWTGSFTYQGITYPYDMVGTNPVDGGTTTVPTEIIPLRLHFADGHVLDATPDAADAAGSPLFQPAPFDEGTTQYGDAIQRGEFWSVMNPDYHVLLAQPSVLDTVDLTVPPAQGSVFLTTKGLPIGVVSQIWLYDRVHETLNNEHLDPTTLPIILTDRVRVADRNGSFFLGFHGTVGGSTTNLGGALHGNGDQPVQTYVYGTWFPHRFAVNADTTVLSHEIAEWLNDPFTNNVAPNWISPNPASSSYGCSNLLEVGDPLINQTALVGGYHLQDEAFLAWFARETPSSAINGQYTMFGTFTNPAPSC